VSIPTITLNDGHTIPQLGLGVFLMDPGITQKHVAFALANGYRHIDTAASYGNEQEVGRAIAESGLQRDELFVTTKLWNDRQTDAPAALAESLDKLGLDYVDLYLIHWPTPKFDTYLDAWHSMEGLRADGLARSIGVSNFHEKHLRRLIAESDVVPAVNQIEVHPTLAQFDLIAVNDELGIATEAWSPLGRKADLDNEVIVRIAERQGKSPAQVILRWHIQRGNIVFPKSQNPDRLKQNFDIFDFELSDDDVLAIDGIGGENRVGPDPETFNRH